MKMPAPSIRRDAHRDQAGFTVVEVLVAATILSVGLLTMAYTFTVGFSMVLTAQEDTVARQKAREAIESVLTARNTETLTYAQIANISQGGVFIDGFAGLTVAGADGLVNTVDDGVVETIINPGPDGFLGTADDIVMILSGYERQVEISTLSPILRQITVTIRYRTPPGLQRQVRLTCYVSPYI
jgi:prepilin-type N-terminal cleavage/methylation domain-containing protein